MTPAAREQARHISEVTKAYAEGKEIQVGPRHGQGPWENYTSHPSDVPSWDFIGLSYRVKPEERKPREVTVYFDKMGKVYHAVEGNSTEILALMEKVHFVEKVLPETETE